MAERSHPSALACDICRKRHLKCDGKPTCQRCIRRGLQCSYTPSRRGQRPSRNASKESEIDNTSSVSTMIDITSDNDIEQATITPRVNSFDAASRPHDGFPPLSNQPRLLTPAATSPAQSCIRQQLTINDRDHLLDIFYTRFAPSHPFLVPRAYYEQACYPGFLETIVLHIARLYSHGGGDTDSEWHDMLSTLLETAAPSVHRVQALTLYGIISHAQHRPRDAQRSLQAAVQIALTLGMNQSFFAQAQDGDNVIAESMRRSWWELWTLDVYLAMLHRRSTSFGFRASVHPHLPCEEPMYEAGISSTLQDISILDSRMLMDEPVTLSSYAYRVAAIRLLERTSTVTSSADHVQALNNALAAWTFHLPGDKKVVIDDTGRIDQLLLQAHCFVHCARIFVHFPRSDLPDRVPTTATISGGNQYQRFVPASGHHTAQAIAASKEISNFAALPWQAEQQSPLFACALILACIVQLAAASAHADRNGQACRQQHLDHVTLLIGSLQALSSIWNVAGHAVQRLKPIARIIFASQPAVGHDDSVGLSEDWLGDDMSWLDILAVEV